MSEPCVYNKEEFEADVKNVYKVLKSKYPEEAEDLFSRFLFLLFGFDK